MYILGINAYHGDSSACLIKDGVLIAAAEEERFRRIKHWAGFPSMSIEFCLMHAEISLSQVDHIAINQDPSANLWRKIIFSLMTRPKIKMIFNRFKNKLMRLDVVKNLDVSKINTFFGRTHYVEHHLSHLSSSFFVSAFSKAAVLSVDGFGDFASTAWGIGSGKKILIDRKVFFPHSLGIFYQALTQWLGFLNYGDEFKVMGLAPYGKPIYLDKMRKIVQLKSDGSFILNLKYFCHHKGHVKYEWDKGEPKVGILFSPALLELLGPNRHKNDTLTQYHKDIARSVQAMYEEAFFNLLNALYDRYKVKNLCLAGGCAMNSVANGKIYDNTPFKKIYIQSAAGDAGGAIGAAFNIWHKLGGKRRFYMSHAYFGPHFSNDSIKKLLKKNEKELYKKSCSIKYIPNQNELCKLIANKISKGKVVGWFQGRMEWGPRALGNRSILGDPRRKNMKDILNLKIKRRESFRPFAPSILREKVSDWFLNDDDVPFMMQVFMVRKRKAIKIPAVTHVDFSGRLQTVTRESNPRYYQLIKEFHDLTGVPIILNTSFNENEPIVCLPEEALNCFMRTKMDILVMQDFCIERV